MRIFSLAIFLTVFNLTSAAMAGEARSDVLSFQVAQSQAGIDAGTAAAIVRSEVGGRVLDVRQGHFQGQPAFRVKVLTGDGRVRLYWVDMRSGRIVN